MKREGYEIDEQGYLKEIYVVNVDENGKILDERLAHLIVNDIPNGLYKARWDGTKWVEGATKEEISDLARVELSPPTAEERLADLELTLVEMMLNQ